MNCNFFYIDRIDYFMIVLDFSFTIFMQSMINDNVCRYCFLVQYPFHITNSLPPYFPTTRKLSHSFFFRVHISYYSFSSVFGEGRPYFTGWFLELRFSPEFLVLYVIYSGDVSYPARVCRI